MPKIDSLKQVVCTDTDKYRIFPEMWPPWAPTELCQMNTNTAQINIARLSS